MLHQPITPNDTGIAQRLEALHEMKERINRNPTAHIQRAVYHAQHTAGPQLARAFSTFATKAARGALGLLQRLPK
jgi:hypothetical protein